MAVPPFSNLRLYTNISIKNLLKNNKNLYGFEVFDRF
jgi:hypothetical protein